MAQMTAIKRREGLTRLLRVIKELRELDSSLPISTVAVFLMAAESEGIGPQAIGDALDMNKSTAGRNLAVLSEVRSFQHAGLGLVKLTEDPRDRRYKEVQLTDKGRRLANRLAALCLDA